jgi:hypothetical protein
VLISKPSHHKLTTTNNKKQQTTKKKQNMEKQFFYVSSRFNDTGKSIAETFIPESATKIFSTCRFNLPQNQESFSPNAKHLKDPVVWPYTGVAPTSIPGVIGINPKLQEELFRMNEGNCFAVTSDVLLQAGYPGASDRMIELGPIMIEVFSEVSSRLDSGEPFSVNDFIEMARDATGLSLSTSDSGTNLKEIAGSYDSDKGEFDFDVVFPSTTEPLSKSRQKAHMCWKIITGLYGNTGPSTDLVKILRYISARDPFVVYDGMSRGILLPEEAEKVFALSGLLGDMELDDCEVIELLLNFLIQTSAVSTSVREFTVLMQVPEALEDLFKHDLSEFCCEGLDLEKRVIYTLNFKNLAVTIRVFPDPELPNKDQILHALRVAPLSTWLHADKVDRIKAGSPLYD